MSSASATDRRGNTFPRSGANGNGQQRNKRLTTTRQRRTETAQTEPVTDPAIVQRTLENLHVRFTNCTFTYKASHFEAVQGTASNGAGTKRSGRFSFRKRLNDVIDKVLDAAPEQTFETCIFVPSDEKDKVKEFIRSRFSNIQITFVNCRFIKRSSTLSEKIKRNLRKVFGIVFEVQYITATAHIDQYKFRMKDISVIYQYLQERIGEDG